MFRPRKWEEYIGQEQIISNIKTYIESSLLLNKKLDHVLIYGNSGMGKTSLAYLIAHVLKVKIHFLNGPSLQKPSDVLSVLTNLQDNDVVFIDEVHAASKEVIELLYPALEDGKINVIVGKEYNAHNINLELPPFTMIVATTELDKVPLPFYNRFPISLTLENYTNEELGQIMLNEAIRCDLPLIKQSCVFLAEYARKTPRIGLNIIKRLNDFYLTSQIKDINNVNELKSTLAKIGILENGLTKNDIKYLKCFEYHDTVGLDNISQIINIPTRMISTMIEPLLISNGYILRTPKGRKITLKGKEKLKQIKRTTY